MKFIYKCLTFFIFVGYSFNTLKAQLPNILAICYHNPNVAVEHMVEVDGSLFSILPIKDLDLGIDLDPSVMEDILGALDKKDEEEPKKPDEDKKD